LLRPPFGLAGSARCPGGLTTPARNTRPARAIRTVWTPACASRRSVHG
jgi:hypothetical protein